MGMRLNGYTESGLTTACDSLRQQFRSHVALIAASAIGACLVPEPWRSLALMAFGWCSSGGLWHLRASAEVDDEIRARKRRGQ